MSTLHFNDVSHYQGSSFPITGAAFIAKATEGTTFVDGAYAGNRKRALAKGKPFAGYHFLTLADPQAQARHAYAVIGKTPAMLDVERTDSGGTPSFAAMVAFITAYRALGGVLHLAYVPEWYWSGAWHSHSLAWLAEHDVALISSHYVHTYTDNGPGWDAYGGVKPAIWQYTDGDTSRGFSAGLNHVDTNAFKGTSAELALLFATGKTTAPEDDMTQAEFTAFLKGALADPDVAAAVGAAVAGAKEYNLTNSGADPKNLTLRGMLDTINDNAKAAGK